MEDPDILAWVEDMKSDPARLDETRNGAGHPQDNALYQVFYQLFEVPSERAE